MIVNRAILVYPWPFLRGRRETERVMSIVKYLSIMLGLDQWVKCPVDPQGTMVPRLWLTLRATKSALTSSNGLDDCTCDNPEIRTRRRSNNGNGTYLFFAARAVRPGK